MPATGLAPHLGHRLGHVVGAHERLALGVDLAPLVVHHVVVLEQVLARVEVARLDLLLRPLQRLVDPGVDDGLAFLEAELLQHPAHAVAAEDAHEVVFEREEEAARARVALPAGAAAELVVDAPALVPLRADDEQAAGLAHHRAARLHLGLVAGEGFFVGRSLVGAGLLPRQHLDVAAELDIRAAAGHVGGDGHGAGAAGLGDDHRLLLVVAGVQHVVRDAALLQQGRDQLRLLDGGGADQQGLAAAARLLDQRDHRLVLLAGAAVDLVVLVLAGDGDVGGDLRHLELVDLGELVGLGRRRAGHAGELGVEAEVVLEGDGGERLVLRLDL
jgi:hypothetical protein